MAMNSDLLSLFADWESSRGHLFSNKGGQDGGTKTKEQTSSPKTTTKEDSKPTETAPDVPSDPSTSFMSDFSTSSFTTVNDTTTDKIINMDLKNLPEYPGEFYKGGLSPYSLLQRVASDIVFNHDAVNSVDVRFRIKGKPLYKFSLPVTKLEMTNREREGAVVFAALRKFNLFELIIQKTKDKTSRNSSALNNSKSLAAAVDISAGTAAESGVDTSSKAAKMMMKMGWAPGTALSEGGLVEPIKAFGNTRSAGLGTQATEAEFNEAARTMLEEFKRSTEFAMSVPGLTNEQRAALHAIGRRLCLLTKSIGGKDRIITISRKGSEDEWRLALANREKRQTKVNEGAGESRGTGAEFRMNYNANNKNNNKNNRNNNNNNGDRKRKGEHVGGGGGKRGGRR